ncbi:hypothetical protein JVT61DRAFT_13251 [Boletus reticuloceps]|uniref:RNase III domain-containing protein n=1 Tax=Boletus reticuloceps TaxID=495285 RepID=A0A8I2YTK9_9AGAM|nr:hypothetical protein JVT61DRAFT_13251 [Boletus reticuloceps]
MTSPAFATPLELPLSQETLAAINDHLRPLDPPQILAWAVKHLPNLYQTTAFGLTGIVAIDMLSKIAPNTADQPPLIFVDTLYHFPETYALVEEVEERYGLKVTVYKPAGCETVADFEKKWGERFWERDEDTYDFAVKVDATGLLKLNPLFAWKFSQVEEYVKANSCPRNKLLDQGYRSVGDWHSTIKSGAGDAGERAGRWAGKVEKTECGLHKDYFAMKAKAKASTPSPPYPPSTTTISAQWSLPTVASMLAPTMYSRTTQTTPVPTTKSSSTWATPSSVLLSPASSYDTYPNLRVGPSTKIRALIVGNTTLASISRRYELPARLRSHPAQAISLRASAGIQADVFESYVGGLYLDQGPTTAEKWLRSLFKPFATEAYIRVRTQHGLPPLPAPVSPPLTPSTSASSDSMPASKEPKKSTGTTSTPAHRTPEHHPPASGTPTTTGHLALFNQQLQKTKREVEWVYDDCVAESTTTTPIWAVRVEVDGEVFGHGKGRTRNRRGTKPPRKALLTWASSCEQTVQEVGCLVHDFSRPPLAGGSPPALISATIRAQPHRVAFRGVQHAPDTHTYALRTKMDLD